MNGAAVSSAVAVLVAAVALRQASPGRRRALHRRSGLARHAPRASDSHLLPPRDHNRGGVESTPASTSRSANSYATIPGMALFVLGAAGRQQPSPPSVALVTPPPRLFSALADAGLTVEPARAWSLWLVSVPAAAAGGLVIGGAGAATVAVGAVFAAPVVTWRLLRRRGGDRYEAALPAAVDAVARALRSGASLRLAIAEAAAATPGALGAELASVALAIDRGASVVSALESWSEHRPTSGVRLVVSALCLGAETGGPLARPVDAVASTLRQRLAARAEARALATQARTSAAVLAAAPLAFAAVTSVADSRTSSFLFRTPTGLLCLAAGLTLDAAGALWMARLTRIDVD